MHSRAHRLWNKGSASTGFGLMMAGLAFSSQAQAQSGGYWELERVESTQADVSGNPCYSHSYSGGAGSATHSQRLVCGNQPWSGSTTGTWSTPPDRLIPGEKVEMSGSARASAAHNGITAGMNLEASFNMARCGGTRSAIQFFWLIAASSDPSRQSVQGRGSATVPGSSWGGGSGNLQLRVCMEGWQTYYNYRWRDGAGPGQTPGTTRTGEDHHVSGDGQHSTGSSGTAGGWTGGPETTYSKWTSITPDQRQFAGQPGRTNPVRVLEYNTNREVQFFNVGQYRLYVAQSDPNGRRISRWSSRGTINIQRGDKWQATLLAEPDLLRMERNPATLLRYSIPTGNHGMIYARNEDITHWRSICVLPVNTAMRVNPDCFGGSRNVIYVPPGTSGDGGAISGTGRSAPVRVYFNGNDGAVDNQPTRPTVVNFGRRTFVATITTYHWNHGRGTRIPGTIALRSRTGQLFGPWRASGQPGSGGAPNAYWVASPNVELPAGSYTIVDSDSSTWAQNARSGGTGHAWIEGETR